MNHKAIIPVACGVGFRVAGQSLELRGDIAPFAESGVSWERLAYHVPALALTLVALTCFVVAGFMFFRRKPS